MAKKEKHIEEVLEEETTETVQEEQTEQTAQAELAEEEKLAAELAEQKDKYLRLYAEYENYRKRTAAEKSAAYQNATADTVSALLPIADSIEQALQNMKDAPVEFTKGLEMICGQMNSALDKLNVEVFGKVGDDFDPELHNAISKTADSELGENKIAAVFQTGYKMGEKIIRHAMVQVVG